MRTSGTGRDRSDGRTTLVCSYETARIRGDSDRLAHSPEVADSAAAVGWSTKVLFIDGFAGPGRYNNGEPGSPLLAIKAARKHQARLASSTVMYFSTKDKDD